MLEGRAIKTEVKVGCSWQTETGGVTLECSEEQTAKQKLKTV